MSQDPLEFTDQINWSSYTRHPAARTRSATEWRSGLNPDVCLLFCYWSQWCGWTTVPRETPPHSAVASPCSERVRKVVASWDAPVPSHHRPPEHLGALRPPGLALRQRSFNLSKHSIRDCILIVLRFYDVEFYCESWNIFPIMSWQPLLHITLPYSFLHQRFTLPKWKNRNSPQSHASVAMHPRIFSNVRFVLVPQRNI